MADFLSPDINSIIASYHPSETNFALPATLNLESPSAKYKSGNVPITSPERSSPHSVIEVSNKSTKVTHIDIAPFLSNAGVRGMVTNVSHGTFYSRPASLVVFSFSLRSGEHLFRFKNANIKITFSKHPSASLSDASPAVAKFAPRKIFGLPTVEGKKNTIGGELTLQVPAGPLTFGPSIKGEKESEYQKEYRFKTVGNFWSTKQGTDWDIVYWDIRENKRTSGGIPDRLNVGIIVEREGSFVATVEVTIDTTVMNGAFSHPWTKNNPAAFVPGVVMGHQPRTRKFELLTEEEWRALIPYEEEWENKFTDSALQFLQDKKKPVPQEKTRQSGVNTSSENEGGELGELIVDLG